MILTNDKFTPKKKNQKPELIPPPGERTQAATFLNDNAFSANTRAAILRATVRLKSTAGNVGSGVILSADAQKAYVLSAKHCLYTLTNKSAPGDTKPSDYNNNNFFNTIQIGYNPAQLLGEPASTAAVTGIDFTGSDDSSWDYDLVIFESTDNAFLTFVTQNNFITPLKNDYPALLSVKKTGAEALNEKNYLFFQLGYGAGRAPDAFPFTKGADAYTDYFNKIQIKKSSPLANSPADGFFEIEKGQKPDTWPNSDQICWLKADNTNSTGEGDSGGPLFCCKITDRSKLYLVGVTTGANFFADEDLKKDGAKLPDSQIIHNNAATYWKDVYTAWTWS